MALYTRTLAGLIRVMLEDAVSWGLHSRNGNGYGNKLAFRA